MISFLTCLFTQWFATPQGSQASHNFLQLTVYNSSNLAIGNGPDSNGSVPIMVKWPFAQCISCMLPLQIHWSMKDKMWFVTLVHWLKTSVLHGSVHISLRFWSWTQKSIWTAQEIALWTLRNSLHAVKSLGTSENTAMQLHLQGAAVSSCFGSLHAEYLQVARELFQLLDKSGRGDQWTLSHSLNVSFLLVRNFSSSHFFQELLTGILVRVFLLSSVHPSVQLPQLQHKG